MDTLHQIQTIILLLMVVLALTTIARKGGDKEGVGYQSMKPRMACGVTRIGTA